MSKTVVNGVTVTRTTVMGVQGPPGPAGPAGAQGVDGAPGADGSNVVWHGAWDVGTTYSELDGVQHDGSAWVATDAVQVGDEPGTAASWELWVSKGDTGEAGADGDAGREVELQKSATHIQWRYEGDAEWADLVALADLKGETGDAGATGETGAAGADGKTVLNGSGAPSSGVGSDGDFYVDTSAWDIYGPKTSGAWGSGTSLVGPQGEQGIQGEQGETGPAGTTDYTELENLPTLGTAAAENVEAFATAAQGAKADSAVQPGDPVSVNAQTGTSYTLVLTDAGKLITLSNGSATTLTIPANSSVDFDAGTVIAAAQLGAGTVTIQGDTGVTVNGTSGGSVELGGQYATASLTQLSDDTWLVSGGLASE